MSHAEFSCIWLFNLNSEYFDWLAKLLAFSFSNIRRHKKTYIQVKLNLGKIELIQYYFGKGTMWSVLILIQYFTVKLAMHFKRRIISLKITNLVHFSRFNYDSPIDLFQIPNLMTIRVIKAYLNYSICFSKTSHMIDWPDIYYILQHFT